ncbi:RNA-directed DNA polymerase-like protein [Cucumis melo var. makuwa]|uniref:RNA-directed DNA polymerase-like protein n=1 Tax=Cucumis melo var. makuwa TaxID=1194695 RepID=A0A5A7SZD8_CUCMM|nr:RNA-directed DNA polymerase-like protein [Cucumis melo var. makuwa]TYK14340.1 RNA-directed DNA polymerase-like protein [Cucumis melo var. makuwa]
MLYLAEVPDSICYLESRLEEIFEKAGTIDAVAGRVEGSSGFTTHMEEHVSELDSSQKTLLEMINGMSEDFRVTLDVVRSEIADVNARLNLTMRAMENQAPAGGAISFSIYFKATNTVIKEAKVTLAMMHLAEDAKLWWRSRYMDIQERRCTIDTWTSRRKNFARNSSLRMWKSWQDSGASLIADSDDKSNQANDEVGQIDGGEKTRIGAIKYLSSLQKKLGERIVPVERGLLGRGQTSKTPLREGFRKNEGREFHCPTYRRTSETNDDKADIRQPNGFKMISAMQLNKNRAQEEPPSVEIPLGALGKSEETVPKDTLCVPEKCHGVMPNSWPKSLSMRRRTDHGIELPSEAKAHANNAYRMTPPKLAVLQKRSKKLLSTEVSRPVQAPWAAPILSLKKKDKSLRWCIDRRIKNKLTVCRIYQFPLLPNRFDRAHGVKHFPKSDIRPRYCRGKATEAEGLEITCVTRLRAYEFLVAPFSLTDAKEEKCCSAGHKGILNKSKLADGVDDQAADPRHNNVVRLSVNLKLEKDREVKEVLADRVRTGRRPTREIHKFLVKWKKPLVEVTSGEHVDDLEAWT